MSQPPLWDIIECECRYIAAIYQDVCLAQGFRDHVHTPHKKRVVVIRWKHWEDGSFEHTFREARYISDVRVEKG
jgi:hypothetical protein